jgi:hypothetical protein
LIWPTTNGERPKADFQRATEHIFRSGSSAQFSARADAEDSKLEKDLLEVLAIPRKPFEELTPRIQPRGRGYFAFSSFQ